jgi:glutaredoxin 3
VAKEFLSSKGVPFEAVDVSASPEVLQAFVEKTGSRATPVIEIGDELVRGWDRGKVERLLKLAGQEVKQ